MLYSSALVRICCLIYINVLIDSIVRDFWESDAQHHFDRVREFFQESSYPAGTAYELLFMMIFPLLPFSTVMI